MYWILLEYLKIQISDIPVGPFHESCTTPGQAVGAPGVKSDGSSEGALETGVRTGVVASPPAPASALETGLVSG